MRAAHDLAKVRQPEKEIRVRRLARPRLNEIRLHLEIGTRMLIAATQGFTDANKDMVAATGAATCAYALIHINCA
jgi:hypothetical protein